MWDIILHSVSTWAIAVAFFLFITLCSLLALARMARNLRYEQRKTTALIESLNVGMLLVDTRGNIDFANAEARHFFGLKKLEQKKAINIYQNGAPGSILTLLQEEIQAIRKEVGGKGARRIYEAHLLDPNEAHLRVTRIYGSEARDVGGFAGTLYVLEDLTKEKQLREREKIVSALKSDFVSIAAHQLRTPLSVMKWVFNMLLEGDLGETTEKQQEFIQKALASNEQMIKLIGDLLDVSRIERGAFGYAFQQVSLHEVIQEVVRKATTVAQNKNIQFRLELWGGLASVRADEIKIGMVLENIIDNAMRYSPPDSIVDVQTKKNEKEIVVSISDSGIGIPEHQQKNIFTRFFRAENARRIQTEGSGLGLFVAKSIIERHGGKIWFESRDGKGSTFYFTLPLK